MQEHFVSTPDILRGKPHAQGYQDADESKGRHTRTMAEVQRSAGP